MSHFFLCVFNAVHTQGHRDATTKSFSSTRHATGSSATSKYYQTYPWYVFPPPLQVSPKSAYNPSSFPPNDISTIITNDLKRDLHFSMKMKNTGDEGLYGLIDCCQLPDVELGLDIDLVSFLAGAISCTLLGLYFDDIYQPRKLLVWWPNRWFFNFLEEGIWFDRSMRWLGNAVIIGSKILYRALYGGMTHMVSRMIYYWFRKLLTGNVPYTPLMDDTFSALMSGFLWTRYTLLSDEHTDHDRIICVGWSAVFTGLLESCMSNYLLRKRPPGFSKDTIYKS